MGFTANRTIRVTEILRIVDEERSYKMSSVTIVQEHNRLTFAVDTAQCIGDDDLVKYRCLNKKVQKIRYRCQRSY